MNELDMNELGIRAVEAFPELFPDAWKHKPVPPTSAIRAVSYNQFCTKCSSEYKVARDMIPCTVPNPMPITWDNAMMLVRACVTIDIRQQLWNQYRATHVRRNDGTDGYEYWLVLYATPADYITAACEEKEATA